ncbi:indole-3-glycerol phosphate synthase TrpC [Clostridium sp. HBUAS56010]|uniref:indole-3-glycerol phosphate synthase TrpC n=1 Tax=Clostridium sp. HBUAS56010 TaxID=2571127 RepID=UPI0011778FCB|nr:indole-3-glycerol phosphate synthase TrpC [Clostridium sp. HBUAS56010]
MILDTLAAGSKKRAEAAKEKIPMDQMRKLALAALDAEKDSPDGRVFEQALKKKSMSFLCEVKRASPSKGIIAEDFPYVEIVKEYEKAGADAISVLTEPDYFLGENEYLSEIRKSVSLPLLRKDFTVDPYQIYEAKVLGASAVLLICSLLDTSTLKEYLTICDSLGLSALTEAHDEREIHSALMAGARIVGVNNRNLKNFDVNLDTCLRLRSLVPDPVIFVAESGIRTKEDIRSLADAGVNGVLIGESLMKSENKKELLESFQRAAT